MVLNTFSCSILLSMKFKVLTNTVIAKINGNFRFNSSMTFILLIIVEMSNIVGIFKFMSRINCMLSLLNMKRKFITSRLDILYTVRDAVCLCCKIRKVNLL